MTSARGRRRSLSHRHQQRLQPWRWERWIIILLLYVMSGVKAERKGTKNLPFVRLRPLPPAVRNARSETPGEQREATLVLNNLKSRGGSAALSVPLLAATGTTCTSSFSQSVRVALAGGIAGAVGTALLYPMDAAKTLRQANPSHYLSVRHAFMDLILSGRSEAQGATASALATSAASHFTNLRPWLDSVWRRLTISKAYRGVLPATLGAIPSSALYFGAYECCKNFLQRQPIFRMPEDASTGTPKSYRHRLLVHAIAAASGNSLSSIVFVPKEVIKNQMQYQHSMAATKLSAATTQAGWMGVVAQIVHTKGLGGLYCGYQATLMRNIPSAILRFCIYEELKWAWHTSRLKHGKPQSPQQHTSRLPDKVVQALSSSSLKFFLAGAVAGALASGLMTPLDVVKTRLATGTCPVDMQPCFWHVLQQDGWSGLYAGAGSRMLWSGAFSAIGFGTFEWAKSMLGVEALIDNTVTTQRA